MNATLSWVDVTGNVLTHTQTENGTVNAKRLTTVTRIIVVEYAGHSGGRGNAIAKSRKPSDRPCIVEETKVLRSGWHRGKRGKRRDGRTVARPILVESILRVRLPQARAPVNVNAASSRDKIQTAGTHLFRLKLHTFSRNFTTPRD